MDRIVPARPRKRTKPAPDWVVDCYVERLIQRLDVDTARREALLRRARHLGNDHWTVSAAVQGIDWEWQSTWLWFGELGDDDDEWEHGFAWGVDVFDERDDYCGDER